MVGNSFKAGFLEKLKSGFEYGLQFFKKSRFETALNPD